MQKRPGRISLFRFLNLIPLPQHAIRIRHVTVAIHMGMSSDQLFCDTVRNPVEIKRARFTRYLAMQYHLKEEVPEFLTHVLCIVILNRLKHFICLLNQIRKQTPMRLLTVPRTTARAAEIMDDFLQAQEAIAVGRRSLGHKRKWMASSPCASGKLKRTGHHPGG